MRGAMRAPAPMIENTLMPATSTAAGNTSSGASLFSNHGEASNRTTIATLASFLGIETARTAKAAFFMTGDGRLITAIVRGDHEVNETKLDNAARAVRGIRPATVEEIKAAGMEPGYGSPIGAHDTTIVVDDLVERSTWLSNQLAELTKQAETTASDLKAEDGPAKFVSESPPAAEVETESFEPEPASFSEPESEHEDKPGGLGFFRRRKGPDVPEGVRLIISQMRSSGEGDREIVKHLEEMGVKDPEALVSSVKS